MLIVVKIKLNLIIKQMKSKQPGGRSLADMSLSDAMNYKNDDDDEDFTSIPGSRTANRMANR